MHSLETYRKTTSSKLPDTEIICIKSLELPVNGDEKLPDTEIVCIKSLDLPANGDEMKDDASFLLG